MQDRTTHHAVDLLVDLPGRRCRSTNQADEQPAIRSSSEMRTSPRRAPAPPREGHVAVRSNARTARGSRRSQPFSRARASASPGSAPRGRRGHAAARARSARPRAPRSARRAADACVAADVVLVEELGTASQNGLGSRGAPSSPTAWRTSTSLRLASCTPWRTGSGHDSRRPAERAAHPVARRARGVRPRRGTARRRTPRQRPLLQTEHEDGVEAPCPCAHQVEHGDPPGRTVPVTADGRALERREHVGAADRTRLSLDRLESSSARATASCAGRS